MTPCLGICRLHKGICEGCYRTLDEIARWGVSTVDERLRIMKEIEGRKFFKGSPCPSCGLDNKCAMDAGKSSNTCWCMSVEYTYNPETNADSCLCKNCLSKEQ